MEMERGPLRLRRGERGRNLTPERGEEMAKVVNGVDVQALGQAVKGFQEKPDLGRFQFKVTNRWEEGGGRPDGDRRILRRGRDAYVGLTPVPPEIHVAFRVQGEGTAEELEELCRFSTVLDVVSHGTDVSIEVEKVGGAARQMPPTEPAQHPS